MTRVRRPPTIAAVGVFALTVLLTGCGKKHLSEGDKLRAIMAHTETVSRKFVYSETTPQAKLVVRGLVEDDFKYKASLSVDGTAIFEEVVADDAVADRTPVPGAAYAVFGRRPAATGGPTQISANGGGGIPPTSGSSAVIAALSAQRWVLDESGAPSLLASDTQAHPLGADPVFDALTIFHYVDKAIGESFRVHKFSPDALDYKPREDPFPKPKSGSGVSRYDFDRPRLPRPQDLAGASANQAIPATRHFRKMAVYVKNGLVIQVLEQVDVASRLADLQRNYNVTIPKSLAQSKQIEVVIDAINAVRKAQGLDPIRLRTMSLQFIDLGKPNPVSLPIDTVAGSLSLFENRGPSAGGSTTTTTAPPG